MQSMKAPDQLFGSVRTDATCAAICRGRRNVALGALLLEPASGSAEPLMVCVERVAFTTLGRLTEADWAGNELTDPALFAPGLGDGDEVTVVHFRAAAVRPMDEEVYELANALDYEDLPPKDTAVVGSNLCTLAKQVLALAGHPQDALSEAAVMAVARDIAPDATMHDGAAIEMLMGEELVRFARAVIAAAEQRRATQGSDR